MASDIDPKRFIEGLRWLATDVLARGVRDIDIKTGADWVSLHWQQDDACAGSEESEQLSQAIDTLADRLEKTAIGDVTLIQENQVVRMPSGRVKFTGERSVFARWKWIGAVEMVRR